MTEGMLKTFALIIACITTFFVPTTNGSVFPIYSPCPQLNHSSPDPRRFYLSTFKTGEDSFADKKFYFEGQGFNNSDGILRHDGLQEIRIVGKSLKFWKKKFFYHLLSSLEFVRDAIRREEAMGYDPKNAYSMHVDYDTVLTGMSMERLWEKFDCARKGKPILIAGETGCLAGLGCTKKQLKRYYDPLGPYRSAFLNAGGIMGSLPALEKMFSDIVDNEKRYRALTWHLKWFCDQNALAHWRSSKNNADMIEIDHTQEVFATIPFQTPNHNVKHRNDGVCRNETGEIHHTCIIVVPPRAAFTVDPQTCYLHRNKLIAAKEVPALSPMLDEVSPDPAVYHGMGGNPSKSLYKKLSDAIYMCRKKLFEKVQSKIKSRTN